MSNPTQSQNAMIERVAAFVQRRELLPAGSGVLAGVSGGADSVAMLAVLRELAPRWDLRLSVAHLNHQLRPEADADEQFVRDLCEHWQLPSHVQRVDVAACARQWGMGIEQAAREARYGFLVQAARQAGASRVAVAHHADDNVETILYRILRGTHLRGLAGIPACRALPAEEESTGAKSVQAGNGAGRELMLVRPMLECTRADIEAFCKDRNVDWRTDSSNADVRYRRNFIRNQLLPDMRSHLNVRVDDALLRLAAAASEADSFLSSRAAEVLAKARQESTVSAILLDCDILWPCESILRSAVIRMAMEQKGAGLREMDSDRCAELAAMIDPLGPSAVDLPGGWRASRMGRSLRIERCASAQDVVEFPSVRVVCPGQTMLPGGGRIVCEVMQFDQACFDAHLRHRQPGVEWLDADALIGELSCRCRVAGDDFRPLGNSGTQSVSDFLTNLKLPPGPRTNVRCICDALGIVYLAPLRIDHRVRVTPQTRRVLRISFASAQEG